VRSEQPCCARRPNQGGHAINRISRLPFALLVLVLVIGLGVPAAADTAPPPLKVPPMLQVPAGQELVWDVTGVGVQIYDCKPSATDPNVSAWTFREPAAGLYDHSRQLVGIHFRGPTWEAFDGSSVVGTPVASAPAPRPGAIPWLLLHAVANQGDGVLASVTYIQRLRTKGGVAPAGPCDPTQDATLSVPYQARYLFYAPAT
jgi:Protein of unknown function (DUF3455)